MAKKKNTSKKIKADSRTLTPKDQEKIQRLLETIHPDNIRLAVSLLEETGSDEDLDSILTDDVILPLVYSGDPEIFIRTGQLALRVNATWQRFSRWTSELEVLRPMMRDSLDDYTYHLTSLSDVAAERLSKHEDYDTLNLNNLKSLSDAAAESISKHKGDWLYLMSLKTLSDSAAESLSRYNGGLSLSGLKTLSDAAADSFSKHKGELELRGLKKLSDSVAESLSKHEGDKLILGDHVKTLSDAAAESLSRHKGELDMYGLTNLSDAAAESLGKHKGQLGLFLEHLPDSADQILRDAGHEY